MTTSRLFEQSLQHLEIQGRSLSPVNLSSSSKEKLMAL